MNELKSEAVLLSVRDWGDGDRIVTMFSKEFGKTVAMAYGARRSKSNLGVLQPFAHVHISVTPGKNIDRIKQCEIIKSFRELREDLFYMSYSSFIAELVSELWPEKQNDEAVFMLLLDAFQLISKRNPRIVALACAWQLLALAGYNPEYENCVKCTKPVTFPAIFDVETGGVICANCGQNNQAARFGKSEKEFLEFILTLNWYEPGAYRVSGPVLYMVEQLMYKFLNYRLDRPLKTLEFIKHLGMPMDKNSQ